MPLQAAAGVHDDVCRHLLEHRCNTVPQMREAVSLLVQMQADGVPCRVEADPTQAFVRAEVGTVFLLSSYIRTGSDVLGYLLVQVLGHERATAGPLYFQTQTVAPCKQTCFQVRLRLRLRLLMPLAIPS